MPPRSKAKQDASQSAGEDDVVMHEPDISHELDIDETDAAVTGADAPMAEADGEEGFDENAEDESEEEESQRVKLLPGSTPTAASFEFLNEGHTLGNALRYVIMKNPDVEFCAYAIPHPSEPKMNVRIQIWPGAPTTAIEALEKGLRDLQDLCDVVTEKFIEARNDFKEQMS
ncbi:DNA-directed RNA polymerase [Immersiella caudata]|uniref:DNA-directed RNA polymerase n=1 Tax=Immersiella caudata TaxID=314043 RepID=A0AA39WWL0_9PEZI|nr:DNA-directed RNA polymerase [Immersiella caudata]